MATGGQHHDAMTTLGLQHLKEDEQTEDETYLTETELTVPGPYEGNKQMGQGQEMSQMTSHISYR